MTANALLEDQERCLAAGMNGFITKPIDPDELWKALIKWLKPRTAQNVSTIQPTADNAENRSVKVLPKHIEGVNLNLGLHHMSGKESLYISILKQFKSTQSQAMEAICKSLDQGDLNTAQFLIHTLKGLAATVGAMPLHQATEELEAALKENLPKPMLDPFINTANHLLQSLISELDVVFPEEANAATSANINSEQAQEVARVLEKIDYYLAEGDAQVLEEFSRQRLVLQAALSSGYTALHEAIYQFDFPKARLLLADARRSLPS
ncbi:Hpt domain-containing protein [Iodobacter sp. BJB302]|uniref:Hpt domain-containing protein n=2 Tax=unclassified Iodobacter TaxID=235634 RepID=UPI000C0E2195|nr:Hpt domain-containing protein [Iodobacter sp. BJB302]PHV03768.1 hypothetical protein CSQ88_00830 [Iodobacter sp. BJB302]